MRTAIGKVILALEGMNAKQVKITSKKIIEMLQNHKDEEIHQIREAFDAGVKYGHSKWQNEDYPAASYSGFMYGNPNDSPDKNPYWN